MRFLWKIGYWVLGMALLFLTLGAYADHESIVGNWQTTDSKTNKPSSIIRIWERQGKFFGKIVKVYEKNSRQGLHRCLKCVGNLHNKPILGLTIFRGLIASAGEYMGGMILDPRNGKFYHCQITVADHGQRLKVRGYLGFSLLGRTDVWQRSPN